MVEILKQPQFTPATVGEQVITIFAGSSGLLDDIPVKAVNKFACSFLQWLAKEHAEYIRELDQTLKLTDELADKLTNAIKTFKTLNK
jgi:F-type H+-transporting ATPase subunit alpha